MTTNELWNVNTLKLPSTIAAANDHSPYLSLATKLSDEHVELEATRVSKAAGLAKLHSRHKELDKKVVEIKASLTQEQKALEKLTAQTINLQASTKNQKKELARINKSINSLINTATPIREEIVTIQTQLIEKVTNAKEAREAEVKATCRSKILLKCHRSYNKAFIKAIKEYYKFSDWKSTKDNRNIGPQTEAILLVFYDRPCFFSQTELELFLG
jgi:chromosome segregation ATPase